MGARHRARPSSIQIIRVETVAAKKCRRAYIKQFHVSSVLQLIDFACTAQLPFTQQFLFTCLCQNHCARVNKSVASHKLWCIYETESRL